MVFVGVQNICSQLDTFQAKLIMRREEGDPQAARWASSVSPKQWAESQGPGSPSWATEQGGAEEACACAQALVSPNTRPLGCLCHEPQKPGPDTGPSVAAAHTHSPVFEIWLITPGLGGLGSMDMLVSLRWII